MSPDRLELVRFIRSTLGCGCPDEVLRSIRVSRGAEAVSLDVGGRLLVRLVRASGLDLGEAVTAGRAERDGSGFNRFRLVAIGADAEELDRLQREWSRLAVDDRLHLHTLGPEAVPEGLSLHD
jgi:hypothetical protein